ncbi:MAG: exodeoxyribonuclease VII large subunit [Chloroflexi bacterium]|nr:exodeoxyribonuclease VII large subunit [Chloroflexota bacterium]MDA1218700.1 exodeoxyribonuclease VII large subunit [Chloroflexota bacterium]PKB57787.1 MAG: exodeoxyribonuclease VII large subunit [SAR202 cluster bacterium Casp-Chloro-G3]
MAVYTVSQVTAYLRESLESDPLLSNLYVLGEVSNLRVSSAGHSYFTLKDGQAVLNCVMFKSQTGAGLLSNGASVSTHGHLSFYEPRGSTDFMVDLVMAEGVGELALELERLKLRLGAEGLFEESRKRTLPVFPQVIGLVTSPSGAVFHDIQNVIRRRYPLIELLLSPTQVQGDRAAPNIVAAIEALNRNGRADVIIVARGGGSLEDLWPFNEESVARAIYASRIPVVSAVGHETDVTIADLVADVRAPTPSAAAELVVPDGNVLRQDLAELTIRSQRAIAYELQHRGNEVQALARQLDSALPDWDTWRRRIDDLGRVAHSSLANRLALSQVEVGGMAQRMGALDPAAILRRGFSVVQRADDDAVVSRAAQVSTGDALTITVSDGVIPATAGAISPVGPPAKKKKAAAQMPEMERLL